MLRIAALSLIASLLCTKVQAEDCELSNNFCVPMFACTLDGGTFFFGRTYGKREGPVIARSADGTECTGQWWRTAVGTGKTKFSCSDGRTGRGTFTYFDNTTGTARGRGRTSDRQELRFWAGRNVLKFVLSRRNLDEALLTCVQNAIRASK